MMNPRDLKSLLVDLSGLTIEEREARGRELYAELYLNRGHFGLHRTHDDEMLIFHQRQFDHAFFTTSDRYCHPDNKDVLRPVSVERIRWIGELVAGRVPNSACFSVPSERHSSRPPKRLYAIFENPFVVWLEPRQDDGWKFSTAYPLSIEEIRAYTRGGSTIWKYKKVAAPIASSEEVKVKAP